MIHEKLLKAWSEHEVPHSDLLAMIKPLTGMTGEERWKLQDAIAEEIERKYPLRKEQEEKGKGL